MNPGKLEDLAVLDQIFTPSFNLLELEARILQHGQLEELAQSIAHCVRCGKCKPDCCVYHPARGMFFHPRNKNLAIGSLIEALLYDAQRERSTRFELLRWLEEVADHCTICHKCLKPCPVDIDTGEVSVPRARDPRELGVQAHAPSRRARRSVPRQPLARRTTGSSATRWCRIGGAVQRAACAIAAPLQPADGRPGRYALQMLRSPLPPVPAETLRDVHPRLRAGPGARVRARGARRRATVFYFPGCGSERLPVARLDGGAARAAARSGRGWSSRRRTSAAASPPTPTRSTEQHSRSVLRDTILFSQIREMFSYLDVRRGASSPAAPAARGSTRWRPAKLFGGRLVDVARVRARARAPARRAGGGRLPLPRRPATTRSTARRSELLARSAGSAASRRCRTAAPRRGRSRSRARTSRTRCCTGSAARWRRRIGRPPRRHGPHQLPVVRERPRAQPRRIGVEPKHLAVALAEKLSGDRWLDAFRAQAANAHAVHF